jgi:hypothetical protein
MTLQMALQMPDQRSLESAGGLGGAVLARLPESSERESADVGMQVWSIQVGKGRGRMRMSLPIGC